jgi:glutamyl-tRNA synthetase
MSKEESDRRAAAGEAFALRFRVPRDQERSITFRDAVYGEQAKLTADIEDFALLRSDGMPTYHLASCADDADLRISHIIRGQDHLSNTFKHVLIFEGAGAAPPQFAHLPLLVAPDGTKLSKRKHGPVVSVTTYRDAGFVPEAFINFLCLLGWSPKNDREVMSIPELTEVFTLEGINRANAVVNFSEADPFDPKAVWLNAEHIRGLAVEELSERLLPVVTSAGYQVTPGKMLEITPLVRERIKLLRDVVGVADFFFLQDLPDYNSEELIPSKGRHGCRRNGSREGARGALEHELLSPGIGRSLRNAAQQAGMKAGPFFGPIRVAVTGRKNAPRYSKRLEVLAARPRWPASIRRYIKIQAVQNIRCEGTGQVNVEHVERSESKAPSEAVATPSNLSGTNS